VTGPVVIDTFPPIVLVDRGALLALHSGDSSDSSGGVSSSDSGGGAGASAGGSAAGAGSAGAPGMQRGGVVTKTKGRGGDNESRRLEVGEYVMSRPAAKKFQPMTKAWTSPRTARKPRGPCCPRSGRCGRRSDGGPRQVAHRCGRGRLQDAVADREIRQHGAGTSPRSRCNGIPLLRHRAASLRTLWPTAPKRPSRAPLLLGPLPVGPLEGGS